MRHGDGGPEQRVVVDGGDRPQGCGDLLGDGQRIVNAIADPFQLGWNLFGLAFFEPSVDWLPPALVWTIQLAAVVGGHVLGAWSGHVVAARSLGLTWGQDMGSIVFPMAMRVALPSWIGLTLGVMKDSALVLWLGIIELLRASQILVTRLQEPMFILMVAGAIYFFLSFPIARLGGRLERRWREND